MAGQYLRGLWVGTLSRLIGKRRKQARRPIVRRLRAELLEDRSVLSVAPFGDAETISLAEYLAQEHEEIGPAIPAALAADSADAVFGAQSAATQNEISFEQLAEGEEGDPPPEDPPPEDPPVEPVVEETVVSLDEEGTITVEGIITDNGGASGLTISIDNATGTVVLNGDGTFTIIITDPGNDPVITITITDADGNTTTITVQNPI